MIRLRPAGDAALLAELPGAPVPGTESAALAAAIAAAALPGVTDVVPGAVTVLVITQPGSWRLDRLAEALQAIDVPAAVPASLRFVDVPVLYDGPDLAEVAALTGLPAAEVIARHEGAVYTVSWIGFSPGFGYLSGLDPLLAQVPRLATPRRAVPAGSVALAGGMAAVYPVTSPGGWRLIGRTPARLWDPGRQPPALLAAGMRVRFHAVGSWPAGVAGRSQPRRVSPASGPAGTVEVLRPGPLATIQDRGRRGFASAGVPPSGAADLPSLLAANRLAGNGEDAACIELTLGRAAFRFSAASRIALAGASAPASIAAPRGGVPQKIPFAAAVEIPAGSVLTIGAPVAGLRTYLAVRGGFDVPAVLGSRSSDLLSGLGPAPLARGCVLRIADAEPAPAWRRADPPPALPGVDHEGDPVLRLVPGPRLDWLAAGALDTLAAARYVVGAASNRTALRLAGPSLDWATDAELPSEGLVSGSIQVPPDGQPILHLADHPVTGGYPVAGVIISADLGAAAQLRPGRGLRFAVPEPGGNALPGRQPVMPR